MENSFLHRLIAGLMIFFGGLLFRGHIFITKDKKLGCYSKSGKLIIPPMYDDVNAIYKNGIVHYEVIRDKKIALADAQNKLVEPWQPILPKTKNKQSVVIETPDEEEVIDNNLDVVLTDGPLPPLVTNSVRLIPSPKNGKWGFEKNGKIVVTHKYDKALPFDYELGLAKVMYKGKWGYINEQGIEYFED